MRPYVIRQGDYLTRLAHRMGFDADAVWNDAANRELRERRPNREILHPGDVLRVPSPPPGGGLDLSSSTGNTYRARVPRIDVRVTLHDDAGAALASKAFVVHGMGAPHRGTTDGAGLVALQVPLHVPEIELVLEETGRSYRLLIGAMDPIHERSGVAKRLTHLGYVSPFDLAPEGVPASALHRAISAFQTARSLPATGEIDDATRDALVAAHGS